MDVYEFSNIYTWGSKSQYSTLQKIISNASSLYMTQLNKGEPKRFQQESKLIKLKIISAT